MKIRKLIQCTALIIASVISCHAIAQHDPVAKEILDRVAEKTKTYDNIKATFTNTLENKVEDFSETFEGVIYIKGKKYKLEMMDTETYFDGETKWVYITESNEVNITNVENTGEEQIENEILNDPTKLLTIYEADFKYLYLHDETLDGHETSVVDLVPESLEKNYIRIRLFVDKNKDELYSIRYFGKDGNHYIFKIKSFETNLPLEENFFAFDESRFPDVEVIDLRE